jgi:hypothetical protein
VSGPKIDFDAMLAEHADRSGDNFDIGDDTTWEGPDIWCRAHNEGQWCCVDALLAAGYTIVPPSEETPS